MHACVSACVRASPTGTQDVLSGCQATICAATASSTPRTKTRQLCGAPNRPQGGWRRMVHARVPFCLPNSTAPLHALASSQLNYVEMKFRPSIFDTRKDQNEIVLIHCLRKGPFIIVDIYMLVQSILKGKGSRST